MTDSLSVSPALIEGLQSWELEHVSGIQRAVDEGDTAMFRMARRVVEAREAGMTQQRIADNIKKPNGNTYSQQWAAFVEKAFYYHDSNPDASWSECWNYALGRLPRPDGGETLSNEWYTPTKYLAAARTVLGKIDLDPASSEEANYRVQATHFYTEADNGLAHIWKGRVWLNPPYGGQSGKFALKLAAEYEAQNVSRAVLLVNANSTDTDWFAPLWEHTLCFTDHRIDFEVPDGVEKASSSSHGSVFVYMGTDPQSFAREFRQFGRIVRSWP